MSLPALALFALSGVGAGFLAGLFGIGGGAVLVPLLYLYLDTRVPGAGLTVVAHATSLAVIVPTAASALVRYHSAGLVPWRLVGAMGSGAALGALATTRFVPLLPDVALRGAFAVFLTVVAVRMLRRRPGRDGEGATGQAIHGGEGVGDGRRPEARWSAFPLVAGGVVGVVSAALGVGGGAVAIPLLLFGVKLDVRRVAAASMGVVAFAAVAGTVGYARASAPGLPPGSVGWVYLPAALALIPGAMVGARWGAAANTRISQPRLRVLFALLLLAVAARIFMVLLRG